jgi:hypothetical protein
MPKTTLYHLSGNSQLLIQRYHLPPDTHIVPFSEKQILSVGKTIAMLRTDSSDVIMFGAKSLVLQRYHQIIKGMMLFAGVRRGALVDELGLVVKYSPLRVIFVDSFRLLFEIVASVWLIIRVWMELFFIDSVKKLK